jgi:hypothetical protein
MTERPSPLDALVDLLVYVPVGLAKTVAEELPVLAAKGKATVEPQLATARLIGQFVVAEGRKRATGLWGFPPSGRSSPAAPTEPTPPTPPPAPFPGPVPPANPFTESPPPASPFGSAAPASPFSESATPSPPPTGPSAGSAVRPKTTSPTPRRITRLPRPAGDGPSPDGLAIPGYDSLSASQVVQRLAGLSLAELAAVGEYEAATRGRRTILARVAQLQGA